VSSVTGVGMPEFFKAMEEKKQEYEKEYKPELERRVQERMEEKKTEGLDKLMKDMNVGSSAPRPRITLVERLLMRTCSY
jgi:GPN-loop GTPase